jgi:hypothetical protein
MEKPFSCFIYDVENKVSVLLTLWKIKFYRHEVHSNNKGLMLRSKEACALNGIKNNLWSKDAVRTYAARSKVLVVLNPSVWVSLNQIGSFADKGWFRKKTHVGKYWTKLKPNSCDIVMIENMDTSGSFMAIISPWTGLSKTRSSNYTQLWSKRWLTNLLRCLCLLLQHPRRDAPDRVDIHMRLAIAYCEAEKGFCWTLDQIV